MNTMTDVYHAQHQDPARYAGEIVALQIERAGDSSSEDPIEVRFDSALLQHLGWQPGDRITLIPILTDPTVREGKLIIRKAHPGEPSVILDDPGPYEVTDEYEPVSYELHGPAFLWPFPKAWVETFLPGYYDEEFDEVNTWDGRTWRLNEFLGRPDQIELEIEPK